MLSFFHRWILFSQVSKSCNLEMHRCHILILQIAFFASFINTSSSNYNIFEHIRNTQNIPPQTTIKTTNVVFLMAWILVFMKCESKLCAISLQATGRSSFRFSSHCWQRLKETDETSIAYIQQNVHHPRKYQVFFFVVYQTAEKKIRKFDINDEC